MRINSEIFKSTIKTIKENPVTSAAITMMVVGILGIALTGVLGDCKVLGPVGSLSADGVRKMGMFSSGGLLLAGCILFEIRHRLNHKGAEQERH